MNELTPQQLTSPVLSPAQSGGIPKKKVAVLGAGIAGLTAAYELAKQGVDVTIFEASGRAGGHMRTDRGSFLDGQYWEAGAELVDTNHTTLRKLMKELGVGEIPSDAGFTDKQGETFYANGVAHSENQFFEAYKPLANVIRQYQNMIRDPQGNYTDAAKQFDNMSMEDFLKACEADAKTAPWVGKMIRQAYTGELGRDTHQLSALAFMETIGADVNKGLELFGDSDEAFRVSGGTDSIITALKGKLEQMGVKIQTNSPVQSISNTSNGMSIRVGDNEHQFDHVISAMPLSALRGVEGIENLGLPPEQVQAIKETNYTTLNKSGVEISREAIDALKKMGSNGTIYGDGVLQNAWLSSEGQSTSGNGVMTFYNGGTTGTMKPNELIEKCKQEVAAVIGMPVEKVFPSTNAVFTAYGKEARGCFVAPAPGQVMKLMSFKQQTHPHFSMVGEFVPFQTERGHNYGYMNNAADSATKEVARTMDLIKQHEARIVAQEPTTLALPPIAQLESFAPEMPTSQPVIGQFTQRLAMQRQQPSLAPPFP